MTGKRTYFTHTFIQPAQEFYNILCSDFLPFFKICYNTFQTQKSKIFKDFSGAFVWILKK